LEENQEQNINLKKCWLQPDGTINCKVGKTTFRKIEDRNITPNKVVFEIEGI